MLSDPRRSAGRRCDHPREDRHPGGHQQKAGGPQLSRRLPPLVPRLQPGPGTAVATRRPVNVPGGRFPTWYARRIEEPAGVAAVRGHGSAGTAASQRRQARRRGAWSGPPAIGIVYRDHLRPGLPHARHRTGCIPRSECPPRNRPGRQGRQRRGGGENTMNSRWHRVLTYAACSKA